MSDSSSADSCSDASSSPDDMQNNFDHEDLDERPWTADLIPLIGAESIRAEYRVRQDVSFASQSFIRNDLDRISECNECLGSSICPRERNRIKSQ